MKIQVLLQQKFHLLQKFIFIALVIICVYCEENRIKLTDLQVLTLTKGVLTTSKRLPPVPQLSCIGGSADCKLAPAVVYCYNRGNDGFEVQWECKADLDKSVKFGVLRITCEGYDYATDPYVLLGSCALEYSLEKLNAPYYNPYYKDYYETNKLGNFLTLLVMILVILAIYKSCTKFHENRQDAFMAAHHIDPTELGYDYSRYQAPPPYGYSVSTPTQPNQLSVPLNSSSNESQPNANSNPPSSGTGFWSGAAGYMFGRSTTIGNSTIRPDTPPPEYEEKTDKKEDNTAKESSGEETSSATALATASESRR